MIVYLSTYLVLLQNAENALAESYRIAATGHGDDSDVHYACCRFARESDEHRAALTPTVKRYADVAEPEPERMHPHALASARSGPVGLLRDLQEVYQLACLVEITWTLTGQAAYGARDRDLIALVARCSEQLAAQSAWLQMRMKAEAAQALLVA